MVDFAIPAHEFKLQILVAGKHAACAEEQRTPPLLSADNILQTNDTLHG
jgi:hypothetical protein